MSGLIILGAGQYGQVAKEVAQSIGFEKIAFLDDNNVLAIGKLKDYKRYITEYKSAFVAIGDAELRLAYIMGLEEAGYEIATLISPKAYVSPSAKVMKGSIVEPLAAINANSTVGVGVLVCAGAIVNHNSAVGEGCKLDCGSVVGSNVKLPAKTVLKYNEIFDKNRAEIAALRPPEG